MKYDVSQQAGYYEANFDRLAWLVPTLASMHGILLSHGADGMSLQLTIVEHSKYTTTIALTHHLRMRPPWMAEGRAMQEHTATLPRCAMIADPFMKIRIYHDARVAEVLSYQCQSQLQIFHPDATLNVPNLREKCRINRFLGEWLDYCIAHGYRFAQQPHCSSA